jgi:hypothetical protein
MVSPGKFVLYSKAPVPLPAGDYVLTGDHKISGSGRDTEAYRASLRVTSPRYKLPPDHVLSTFPPANSEGAYESRLPQIVLKRRTLAWERIADAAFPATPWLALVVIAEGEGHISAEADVSECVTPGKTLSGPNDVAKGIYLSMPESTVKKVFPTREDVDLLAHVREVDLEDTELAMGDDDGFLCVIMANRLPQFDRAACKPVRYAACLINLEGQLAALPPPTVPVKRFDALAEVFDASQLYVAREGPVLSPDKAAMNAGALADGAAFSAQRGVAARALGAAKAAQLNVKIVEAVASAGVSAEWASVPRAVEKAALNSAASDVAAAVRDAMKGGFRLRIEGRVFEKTYRFPILTHWSFTCDGAGSFESLMRGIDVGLLGTLPNDPVGRMFAECVAPIGGTAPPAAPKPRPDPEIAETGHAGLAHTTRVGDKVRAWYRGPFVPSPTSRELFPEQPKPVLAHTSDQLRSVVPDGREDLSLAVAFEIGRLLALSKPAFVSALMNWRREQFGAARARRLAARVTGSIRGLGAIVKDSAAADFGKLFGKSFVLEAAKRQQAVFGPLRPLADPGRPIEYLGDRALDILSAGLAIPNEALEIAVRTGAARSLEKVEVPVAGRSSETKGFVHLARALSDEVQRIAADAITKKIDENRPNSAHSTDGTENDALDGLIDEMSRQRGGNSR